MKNSLKHIILTLLSFLCFLSYSQQPNHYKFNTDNGLPTNEIYSCYESENGLLYITHDLGVSVWDGSKFNSIKPNNIPVGTSCYSLNLKNDTLWFKYATNELYYLINGEFFPYEFNSILKQINAGPIIDYSFIKGKLHLSFRQKAFLINEKGRLQEKKLDSNKIILDHVNSFIIKKDSKTKDSIKVFDSDGNFILNRVSHFNHFGSEPNGLPYFFDGAMIFWKANKLWNQFEIEKNETKQLNDQVIINIEKNGSKLFVSTKANGLHIYKIDKNTLHLETKILEKDYIGIISIGKSGIWVPSLKNGLYYIPNYEILNYNLGNKNIWQDTINQNLFLTSYPNEKKEDLFKIDKNRNLITLKIDSFTHISPKLYSEKIDAHSLKNTIHGYQLIPFPYYFGDFTSSYTLVTGIYGLKWFKNNSLILSKPNFKAYCGIKTSDQSYLFGTPKGLQRLKINSDSISIERVLKSTKAIKQIQKIDDREIIITQSNKIYRYNLKNKILTDIYINDQAIINCSFLKDSLLFIGTKEHLRIINLNNQKQFAIDHSDGLSNSNISTIKSFQNYISVGNENGISLIPFVFIKDELNKQITKYDQYLKISKTENGYVSIDFKLQELNPRKKMKFKYRLNDNEFIETENKHIKLTNLSYGNYQFEMQIQIGGDNWIPLKPRYFSIPEPFYRKWWFASSILLFIFLILIFIIRKRNQIQTKKLKTENLISTLRMNALTSQMNPHFLFNALNTIQGLIGGDSKYIYMYISDLARFFRLMLNNSSDLYIPLEKEIELNAIFCEIENVRQKTDIKFNVEYQKKEFKNLRIPSLIIQPFVENVTWHAFNKTHKNPQINISISEDIDDYIKIEITDNGIGIHSSSKSNKAHQSKGVSIVENRLKLFNKEENSNQKNIVLEDLNLTNSSQKGTKVTVRIKKRTQDDLHNHDY